MRILYAPTAGEGKPRPLLTHPVNTRRPFSFIGNGFAFFKPGAICLLAKYHIKIMGFVIFKPDFRSQFLADGGVFIKLADHGHGPFIAGFRVVPFHLSAQRPGFDNLKGGFPDEADVFGSQLGGAPAGKHQVF